MEAILDEEEPPKQETKPAEEETPKEEKNEDKEHTIDRDTIGGADDEEDEAKKESL